VGPVLDDDLLAMPEIQQAIESGTDASVSITINNVDRSSTGRLGGRVAAKYGDKGFPATININMQVRVTVKTFLVYVWWPWVPPVLLSDGLSYLTGLGSDPEQLTDL
jgi:hypothetical protein